MCGERALPGEGALGDAPVAGGGSRRRVKMEWRGGRMSKVAGDGRDGSLGLVADGIVVVVDMRADAAIAGSDVNFDRFS